MDELKPCQNCGKYPDIYLVGVTEHELVALYYSVKRISCKTDNLKKAEEKIKTVYEKWRAIGSEGQNEQGE